MTGPRSDLPGERDVGVERPVGVARCVEGRRRVGGPNWYALPDRLERGHDLHEAIREARVHDEQGMDVGRDGRVVGEDGKGVRAIAVLARAGRRVIPEGEAERQQVTLRRALVIVHQQAAEASVETLVFPEDLVGASRHRRERDGQGDHERETLVLGDELINKSEDPVGESVDVPGRNWGILVSRAVG